MHTLSLSLSLSHTHTHKLHEPPSEPEPSKPCLKKSQRINFCNRSAPPYFAMICAVQGSAARPDTNSAKLVPY